MTTEVQRAIESGFESPGHYLESMRDFDRVLDYLDRTENISEETKEKYHHYFDEIGLDGVFELARNTNELFKELGINSYRLQRVEGGLIGGRATVETHGDQMRNGGLIGGLIGGRKGAEARGQHVWSLEEKLDIHKFREESFNHSSKYCPNSPNWNYTTSKMNEKYGENWSTGQVRCAYHYNKDKLPDEEE